MSTESDIHKIAESKGLPEFSTKQLIELIKIELLYTSYKKIEDIVCVKPTKPKKLTYPIEPTKPIQPKEPELKTISGNSAAVEAINLKLYEEYKLKIDEYPALLESFEKNLLDYNKKQADYELAVKNFDKNEAQSQLDEIKYKKDLNKYERFLHQKELNKKIEETYTKWTGKPWNNNFESKLTYFMLIGPPGHGKTTVFRQSAKLVAKELGLVYQENPTVDTVVNINSFVVYVNNLAGEVSKTGTAGLPSKVKDEDGNEYTGLLPSYAMSALTKAGAGMLLLDDLANASSFIQNIALPLTHDNSFNELKLDNVYVGITSNLGALDGTNISKISSALRNRLKMAFTTDNVDDFIYRARVNENYFDEIGDFFVTDFLESNKNDINYLKKLFFSLPSSEEMGGFSNPRSLDATITDLRRIVYDKGGFNDESKKIIELTIKSLLGNQIGQDFYEYVDSTYEDVVPMIDDYFNNNVFSKDKYIEKTKNTLDITAKSFDYQFRKYFEKKIRNEGFSINKIEDQKDKSKKIDKLFDKIASIYILLPEGSQAALSKSLREDVFVGLKSFTSKHILHNSGETLQFDHANKLTEKILKLSGYEVDEVLNKNIQEIIAAERKKEEPQKIRPKMKVA